MLDVKWRCELGALQKDEFGMTPRARAELALRSDGAIVVGLGDGRLCCVNPPGKLLWNRAIPTKAQRKENDWVHITPAPAVGKDDMIYISSPYGEVCAIGTAGQILWRHWPKHLKKNFYVFGPPAIGEDGTVYTIFAGHQLTALSPKGQIFWKYALPDKCEFLDNPVITADQGLVLTMWGTKTFDWFYYRFSPDGKKVQRCDGGWAVHMTPAPREGIVYAPTAGLSAIDTTRWSAVKQGDR